MLLISNNFFCVHTVDHNNIYESVLTLYSDEEVALEYPLVIKFKDLDAIDAGGVQREMFTLFWDSWYTKCFEGGSVLAPILHAQVDYNSLVTIGRIMSHSYLACGILPIKINLPTLITIFIGVSNIPDDILLEAFMNYLSIKEQAIINEANMCNGDKFSEDLQERLLDILSLYGCRTIPLPSQLTTTLIQSANYLFVHKSLSVIMKIHSGIPKEHQRFWKSKRVEDLVEIYRLLTLSPEKVLSLMSFPRTNTPGQLRAVIYLKSMVMNLSKEKLAVFVRFVTGSSVCTGNIIIAFNSLRGLERRPIAHTCDGTLELATTYENYEQFEDEFRCLFATINQGTTMIMDSM